MQEFSQYIQQTSVRISRGVENFLYTSLRFLGGKLEGKSGNPRGSPLYREDFQGGWKISSTLDSDFWVENWKEKVEILTEVYCIYYIFMHSGHLQNCWCFLQQGVCLKSRVVIMIVIVCFCLDDMLLNSCNTGVGA